MPPKKSNSTKKRKATPAVEPTELLFHKHPCISPNLCHRCGSQAIIRVKHPLNDLHLRSVEVNWCKECSTRASEAGKAFDILKWFCCEPEPVETQAAVEPESSSNKHECKSEISMCSVCNVPARAEIGYYEDDNSVVRTFTSWCTPCLCKAIEGHEEFEILGWYCCKQ